jgi:hypothetical protein
MIPHHAPAVKTAQAGVNAGKNPDATSAGSDCRHSRFRGLITKGIPPAPADVA